MDPILFIQDLVIILLSAAIAGMICRRIGLSPVLGYLVAGLIIGTPEIVFPYVTDEERLRALSQLGLVFLMFSIGLRFRLQRIKALGFRVVLAAFLTALSLFTLLRWGALIGGFSPEAAFCLAAMFLSSSSAIIGKLLQERRLSHERYGQIAMGMTLLEDIVAVVVLAILGSLVVGEMGDAGAGVLGTIGLVIGFTVLLVVLGLVFLTRIVAWIRRKSGGELLMIFVVGVVLGAALVASKAGYSLALGAFVSGLILAESRPRVEIERNFTGMRDVFLTIFFVVIGMQVEVRILPEIWGWIVLAVAIAMIGRALVVTGTLILVCEPPRTALGAGLLLTPLGEFSFIIAALAISAGFLPPTVQGIAVGSAVLTTLLTPLIAGQHDRLVQWLPRRHVRSGWFDHYRIFWESVARMAESHQLWRLLRMRIVQVAVEVILVSSLLVFSPPLVKWVMGFIATETEAPAGTLPLVLNGLLFLLAAPLIYAIIRNLHAMAWLVCEYLGKVYPDLRSSTATLRNGIVLIIMTFLAVWWWNLLPQTTGFYWIIPAWLLMVLLLGFLFRRKLVLVYSQFQVALEETLQEEGSTKARVRKSLPAESWGIRLEEVNLPDDTVWAGRMIAETRLREKTGVSIVGLERQGFALSTLSPQGHLFPGDQLLLLGTREGLPKALALLNETQADHQAEALQAMVLESAAIEAGSAAEGKTLIELRWPTRYRVQVVGQERKGRKTANPEASTCLLAGDHLLLMGSLHDIQMVRQECSRAPDPESPVQPT